MIQAIDYDGNDHQLITGVPGSGKTTVTIMRAERLMNLNKSVKVFTYQNLLRTSLKNIAAQSLQNQIFGFYEWYYNKFGYLNSNDNEEVMLDKMADVPVVDEILIDEGQDFEERIFRSLLPKCRRMTVGADNAQKVHEKGILANNIKHELERNKPTIPVRLEYNYRNTYEIYNFARHFMPYNERANNPITMAMMPRGNGNIPVIINVSNDEEKWNRLKVLVEDAGDRNIAILLYHQSEVDSYYTKMAQLGLSCTKHHHRAQAGNVIENILITTYKSAKGLEFQVVILPDMQTAMDSPEKTPEHYYIGCTRAKESLFLMYTGSQMPRCFDGFDQNSYITRGTNDGQDNNVFDVADDLPF